MVSIPLAARIFSNDLLLRLTHHTDMTEILVKQSINLYLLPSVPTPLHLPPPPAPTLPPPRPVLHTQTYRLAVKYFKRQLHAFVNTSNYTHAHVHMNLHKRIQVVFRHSPLRKMDIGKLIYGKNTFILERISFCCFVLTKSRGEREKERESLKLVLIKNRMQTDSLDKSSIREQVITGLEFVL